MRVLVAVFVVVSAAFFLLLFGDHSSDSRRKPPPVTVVPDGPGSTAVLSQQLESTDAQQTGEQIHRESIPRSAVPSHSRHEETAFTFFPGVFNDSHQRRILAYLTPTVRSAGAPSSSTTATTLRQGVEESDGTLTWQAIKASSTAPSLDLLMCPREWLYDFLHAHVNHYDIPPRHRMGEVRTWSALLGSLVDLGCSVRLSKECRPHLDHWDHSPPVGNVTASSAIRVLVLEDLSLAHLARLPSKELCQRRSQQTIAIAGEHSKLLPNDRVLPLFHIAEHTRSLGLVADCGGKAASHLRKRWFGVLWGKTKQEKAAVDVLRVVSKYIPMVSTCSSRCSTELPAAMLSAPNATARAVWYQQLIEQAVIFVGAAAPNVGAACPEALSCGTYVVARGRSLGFEFAGHRLTRRFRKLKDMDRLVREVLVDRWGFNESYTFDQQPQPPDKRRAWGGGTPEFLPKRYTPSGHRLHVARLFGITADGTCSVDTSRWSVRWEASGADGGLTPVFTARSSPDAHAEPSALSKALSEKWSWEGCVGLPYVSWVFFSSKRVYLPSSKIFSFSVVCLFF